MALLWIVTLSFILTTINSADLTIPNICFEQAVLNGSACCASLQQQCEIGTETFFNCTHSSSGATNLLYLSMRKCELTGTIPTDITKLPYLIRFDLSYNYLEGTIPSNIGDIGNSGAGLVFMDLCNNDLEGNIPKSMGDDALKTSLKYLDLSYNNFVRANLPTMTELAVIEHLNLSHNNIAESFHESFLSFEELKTLNIGDNRFGGTIPNIIGALVYLEALVLERNSMTGTIPEELSAIMDLKIVNLSENRFVGDIPEQWGLDWGPQSLEFLNLGQNDLNCPVLDYSKWAKSSDFNSSYGQNGKSNCLTPDNGGSSSDGLDGVEVAIIVIAVIVLLAIGLYCWHGKNQAAVREQVVMLTDKDVFDD